MHSIIHLLLPFLATSTLVHGAAIEAIRSVTPGPYADNLESRDLSYLENLDFRDLPDTDNVVDLEARALMNATCPDWNKIEPPEKNLGPPLKSRCSWKATLICASLLVGCPAGCIAAAMEVGLNPLATTECIACLGVTGGNCAFCIWGPGLAATCNAIYWEPQAHCLLPLCNQKLINDARAHPPPQVMANRLLPGLAPEAMANHLLPGLAPKPVWAPFQKPPVKGA